MYIGSRGEGLRPVRFLFPFALSFVISNNCKGKGRKRGNGRSWNGKEGKGEGHSIHEGGFHILKNYSFFNRQGRRKGRRGRDEQKRGGEVRGKGRGGGRRENPLPQRDQKNEEERRAGKRRRGKRGNRESLSRGRSFPRKKKKKEEERGRRGEEEGEKGRKQEKGKVQKCSDALLLWEG